MKKLFVLVLLIGAAAYVYHQRQRDPGDSRVVFGEARYTYEVQGRDIEVVVIGERPETAGCLRDSVIQKFQAVCDANTFCSGTRYECKMSIAPRYQKMLDQTPAATHFVHVQHLSSNMRAVALLWGLTAEESLAFCAQMATLFGNKMGEQVRVQCI